MCVCVCVFGELVTADIPAFVNNDEIILLSLTGHKSSSHLLSVQTEKASELSRQ